MIAAASDKGSIVTYPAIPYRRLKTLFLDAGNTVVAMKLSYIVAALKAEGIQCDPTDLRRAEAAARPAVSAALPRLRSTETIDAFEFYIREMLGRVSLTPAQKAADVDGLAHGMVPLLDRVGRVAFWSAVIPGVPEALAAFRDRGLQLAVVSNSDGTIEELLRKVGLRQYFDAVIDSHVIGYEKPDPRIFRHALDVVGARANTTLHVGDLYEADVVGARAAGVHALLLDPFNDWHLTDCERAADLTGLLERLGD
ncbi:MAG: hypothetical protein CL489_15810 [Acidobacteria bacterium]|nr:hypothetical protein [Acidobacteriota bacterium]MBF85920.1 hypothetical protein [Acidobacteriota bacterium]